jgi:glyoxylase-like metal-dependent hydrolase (beta-lactamase superfamily II)
MNELRRVTEHVYWLTPSKPDRPSLAAIIGQGDSIWLDAGASAAHVQVFREQLRAQNLPDVPRYVALTHWHWDHVFGAAHIPAPLIAHRKTADQLAVLAGYAWDDAALDARVLSGEEIEACATDIKLELPAPRSIKIAQPNIIFQDALELHLGGVTCTIEHVGGDHAADSCVMHILPDKVLFLGDCLYDAIYTPVRHYTTAKLFPLIDKILAYEADFFIEGHADIVASHAEMEMLLGNLRLAGTLVEQHGADEAMVLAAVQAQTGSAPDEVMTYFVEALAAGKRLFSS